MKRSFVSIALFGPALLLLSATAMASALPKCLVDRKADGTLDVSVPAVIARHATVFAWTLDSIPVDDTTRSITFHVDPFADGAFVIRAYGARRTPLCRSTLIEKGQPLTLVRDVSAPKVVMPRKAPVHVRAAAPRPYTANLSSASTPTPFPPPPPPPPPPVELSVPAARMGEASVPPTPLTPAPAAAPSGGFAVPAARMGEASVPPNAGLVTIKVYFATEREPKPGPALKFAGSRSTTVPVRYGTAFVTIPPTHKTGEIETRRWLSFSAPDDPSKYFTASLRLCSEADLYDQIHSQIDSTGHKEIFVFIHGFNNSFDEELFRTAQLAYDTGFEGEPIMYDWPSWGEPLKYAADVRAMTASVRLLRDFLKDIAQKTGADKVDLIAHSLGNSAMIQALDLLRLSGDLPQLNQIIMAAPDVDSTLFDETIPALYATGKINRFTMYASRKDLAMKASWKENGVYPVGGLPPLHVVANVDTIDVSRIETNFIGHDYFVTAVPVLEDLGALLRQGTPPPRSHILPVADTPIPHWQLSDSP